MISRRQQHYHSQRRDNREPHQRPVSNFYEYESVQSVIRSSQHLDEGMRSNHLQDEGMRFTKHQEDAVRSKQHRDEETRSVQRRNEEIRSVQRQEEGQSRDDALRTSQHQRGTVVTVSNNNSNSLQRKTQLQDNKGGHNKNNSKYLCCLCPTLIMLKSYMASSLKNMPAFTAFNMRMVVDTNIHHTSYCRI